jgi:hypothetical protein
MAICFWLAAAIALATPAARADRALHRSDLEAGAHTRAARDARIAPPPMVRGRRYAQPL